MICSGQPLSRAEEENLAWSLHAQMLESPRLHRIKLRDTLAERQNWRCCYCGCRMYQVQSRRWSATLEHVRPRSRGGSDTEDNLVVACQECNVKRGNNYWPEHIEVFRAIDEANREASSLLFLADCVAQLLLDDPSGLCVHALIDTHHRILNA